MTYFKNLVKETARTKDDPDLNKRCEDLVWRADLAIKDGDLQDAVDLLKKAYKLMPDKKTDKAKALLARIAKINP